MIKLTDNKTNTSIVYLFVREFKWLDAMSNENNGGHPRKGRVYRAGYNKDTKTYRLAKEDEANEFIFIPALTSIQKEDADFLNQNMYESEIVELTRHNIVECDILEEDLTKIVSWIDEDNKSIKQIMGIEGQSALPGRPVSFSEVSNAVAKAKEEQEDIVAVNNYLRLKDQNPPAFDAVGDFIVYLLEDDDVDESSIDTSWLGYSKAIGAGKNISEALSALSRYGGDNRRTNMMQKDLFLAQKSLLAEQIRRNFHGIEE